MLQKWQIRNNYGYGSDKVVFEFDAFYDKYAKNNLNFPYLNDIMSRPNLSLYINEILNTTNVI